MPPLTNPSDLPAGVQAVLRELRENAQAMLGKEFIGLYLYGSLASGDFEARRSDIDFVVITRAQLPEETIQALARLHARMLGSGSKWAAKLEGCYLPRQFLRRHNPDDPAFPTINEGHFYMGKLGSDWILQRHILREHETIIAGPSLRAWIDPISPDELRQAIGTSLAEWWLPHLTNPTRLQSSEYQAYTIVTMCRALYTLEHGTIQSKPKSARWAQQALGEAWAEPIEQAQAWQPGVELDAQLQAQALIRYTCEQYQIEELP
jgi:hypothetical protein